MEIKNVPIDSIQPYKLNPRLNERAIAPVAASIKEFNWQQPIVVDAANVIIAGHTRLLAAKSLGLTEVPIVVANLTEDQAKAYRLADNRTNENAEWDWSLLGEEITNLLENAKELVPITGFNSEEIKKATTFDGGGKRKFEADPRPNPVTAYGEVWTSLDQEHLVLCTENTSELFKEHLKGKQIDMILTDPPYNIAYSGAKGTVNNDELGTEAEFAEFLKLCFSAAAGNLRKGGAVITCGYHTCFVPNRDALAALDITLKQELVWVKSAPMYNPGSQYRKQHENLWIGWKTGAAQHQNAAQQGEGLVLDERDDLVKLTKEELIERILADSTVRQAKHETDKLANHPTVKPTALFAPLIKKSTMPGDLVCDIFAGSGVTALACYELGRKSISTEMDPSYVDCILSRMYEHKKVDFKDQNGRLWSTLWEAEKQRRESEELD